MTGGFPLAILERTVRKKIGEQPRRALLDGFRSDLSKSGKNESTMKEVIAYLINARAEPISWLSIAKNTSIASLNTAKSYGELLKDLMVVTILEYVDASGKIIHRKNRKVHFIDPFLYNVLAEYTRVEPNTEALVEGVVASHIARRFRVHYWRNSGGVDCVVFENGESYGFEVKWNVKHATRPRWVSKFMTLNKENLPLFLVSLST